MPKSSFKARWRRLQPWLAPALALLVAAILLHAARSVDWGQVWTALRHIPRRRLYAAAAFASASYACYACTDLFALDLMQHRVGPTRAMCIAFVAYAFNQNFGSLLGTIGFRLRLYSNAGVEPVAIARIVGLSFLTNWSGYFLLAGVAFASGSLRLPRHWALGAAGLQAIGAALLLVACAYLALCAGARRRQFRIFGVDLELPSWRRALTQFALSAAIWLNCAAAMVALVQGVHGSAGGDLGTGPAPALRILTVLLLASIAGLISHVPGGVGVLEAVFFALLGRSLPHPQLLAALLAYRALYYFWPLLPALGLYAWLEAQPAEAAAPRRPDEPGSASVSVSESFIAAARRRSSHRPART